MEEEKGPQPGVLLHLLHSRLLSIYVLFQLSESYSINTMNFKSPMASSTHYAFNAF